MFKKVFNNSLMKKYDNMIKYNKVLIIISQRKQLFDQNQIILINISNMQYMYILNKMKDLLYLNCGLKNYSFLKK